MMRFDEVCDIVFIVFFGCWHIILWRHHIREYPILDTRKGYRGSWLRKIHEAVVSDDKRASKDE
ncbi:hypothetical protein BS50DRAFT_400406 [Corynespora cassiicola Philippines]|uniref:Uncharacterized protein n=1 Tax=Corynespora cassiicola Philippines TaxID=1448308 RepID=A0A2T2NKB3_CORCC|nr:hypothetical protein BS50DRAFT_400406 [Corynespora cassiicola Philippines]